MDRVFFRSRHEDEEALRTFAHETPYVTDRDILLRRAAQTLDRHTDAMSVEIVLRFDDNDPAIVRLRAHPQVLDLHGVETTLRGDIGFPMTAHGQLLGVIVLGARSSGERYAPDEIAAISQLATSLGAALDIFTTRDGKDGAVERLVASVDALREELIRRFPTAANENSR